MKRPVFSAAVALALAGCAGSGGTISDPQPAPTTAINDVADDPDFVQTESDDAVSPPTTEFDLAAQPSTPEIPAVPETGVPGIDSADAFCRAWSEFAGSFQAVGLVSAVGDAGNAMRLEVFAAPAVVDAVLAIDANLPDELESERVALVADFAGPYLARASVADGLLVDGMGEALAPAWVEQLSEAGLDDPFFDAVLPTTVDEASFTAAVDAFAAAFPPIVDDPSLVTDVQIPLTEAYLASTCPDGGTLSGNDVISE